MDIAQRTGALPSNSAVRNHDGWIIIGYAVLAAAALTVIHLASAVPMFTDGDLILMAAMY